MRRRQATAARRCRLAAGVCCWTAPRPAPVHPPTWLPAPPTLLCSPTTRSLATRPVGGPTGGKAGGVGRTWCGGCRPPAPHVPHLSMPACHVSWVLQRGCAQRLMKRGQVLGWLLALSCAELFNVEPSRCDPNACEADVELTVELSLSSSHRAPPFPWRQPPATRRAGRAAGPKGCAELPATPLLQRRHRGRVARRRALPQVLTGMATCCACSAGSGLCPPASLPELAAARPLAGLSPAACVPGRLGGRTAPPPFWTFQPWPPGCASSRGWAASPWLPVGGQGGLRRQCTPGKRHDRARSETARPTGRPCLTGRRESDREGSGRPREVTRHERAVGSLLQLAKHAYRGRN